MRRTERFAVELPVTWNRAGRAVQCLAVDVNQHGMFVRTEEVVEHESLLHLKVNIGERELEMFVTARFVGRTASGQGIGCEIFLIDDVAQCHWLAFYQNLAASHGRAAKLTAVGG